MGLNTGQEGMTTIKTKKIKGELMSFIFSSNNKVFIGIESELGYPLLELKEFSGKEYYPLRIRAKDLNGHGENYGNVFYQLNESLIISVSGPKDSEVNIIIRIK